MICIYGVFFFYICSMSKYAIEVVWVGWSNTKTITESSIITVGQGQARKIGSKIGESKKRLLHL